MTPVLRTHPFKLGESAVTPSIHFDACKAVGSMGIDGVNFRFFKRFAQVHLPADRPVMAQVNCRTSGSEADEYATHSCRFESGGWANSSSSAFFFVFFFSHCCDSLMTDFAQAAQFVNAVILPVFGLLALLHMKFSMGEAERRAQNQFFACLAIMTLVTIRTVAACDACWLIHMTTTAVMILGALVVPSRSDASESAATA